MSFMNFGLAASSLFAADIYRTRHWSRDRLRKRYSNRFTRGVERVLNRLPRYDLTFRPPSKEQWLPLRKFLFHKHTRKYNFVKNSHKKYTNWVKLVPKGGPDWVDLVK